MADAAATNALMSMMRDQGLQVSLASGRVTLKGRAPADQLIVAGPVAIERLYDLFATARFGQAGWLRASVFEYGPDYIGLEIIEFKAPTEPMAPRLVPAESVTV